MRHLKSFYNTIYLPRLIYDKQKRNPTNHINSFNGGAILGAFIGAVLYVTIASDSSIKQRVVFMLASFFAGYLGSPLFEIATDEDISLHKELRKYRVLLNRVSNQEG